MTENIVGIQYEITRANRNATPKTDSAYCIIVSSVSKI